MSRTSLFVHDRVSEDFNKVFKEVSIYAMPESILFIGISVAVVVVAAIVFFFLGIVYRKRSQSARFKALKKKQKE